MRKPKPQEALYVTGAIVLFVALFRGWESIVNFVGIVLTAIIPLVLGICVAYIVSIPTAFFERHLFPNAKNGFLQAIRRPLALAISVFLTIVGVVVLVLVLAPAIVETAITARDGIRVFLQYLMTTELFAPYQKTIQAFLNGDVMANLDSLDVPSILKNFVGGTMTDIGTHVFTFVSMLMTGFFGLLFAAILLNDTNDTMGRLTDFALIYLGPKRTERLAVILGVADTSFHNFTVRQFTEASILGLSAFVTLFVLGHPYALGAAALMGVCALIPIVGFPVGLISSAIVVAVSNNNLVAALIYIVCVALVQMVEATFVLPHIGDPRTVLTPVWTTVGVTIGGGVAGFIGMLVAIPTCATIHQLIRIDMNSRGAKQAALQEAETERMIENVLERKRLMELASEEERESNPDTASDTSADTGSRF